MTDKAARTVWKFPLGWHDVQVVNAPTECRFLHVALEGDTPYLWAEVAPYRPHGNRRVAIVGTGNPIPDGYEYLGTVHQGLFVWHVYVQ